jgi:hypothetical protein
MKTPLTILAEIQMLLAEHTLSHGSVSDRECIARITKLLDTPEVVAASLGLQPVQAVKGSRLPSPPS